MADLCERASNFVAKMPAAVSGQNGHGDTFHVACVLVQGFGLSPSQAFPIFREYNARCEPPWTEADLSHKLQGAEAACGLRRKGGVTLPRGCLANGMEFKPSKAYLKKFGLAQPTPAVAFDESKLKLFAGEWSGKIDLIWLAERSAEDPCSIDSSAFLSKLYKPSEKVIVFTDDRSQGQALWPSEPLPASGPEGVWFLAQPVDGKYYPNPRSMDKQGNPRMSRRSEESVTAFRYFVIESDKARAKLWLAALVQLPLRIAAIYSSGGRSVHALVQVGARTKMEWDAEKIAMKQALVTLGADPGAMSAVRLTRLPGCERNRKLQKLLYLQPKPEMRPLIELPPRRDVLKPWLDWASLGISDADEDGGAALTRALSYYAPVSPACEAALRRLKR